MSEVKMLHFLKDDDNSFKWIQALQHRWKTCVDRKGDDVQKYITFGQIWPLHHSQPMMNLLANPRRYHIKVINLQTNCFDSYIPSLLLITYCAFPDQVYPSFFQSLCQICA